MFFNVINMSITASYVILFVIVVRQLFKKYPKIFAYMLWSVVLFRLISPLSFEGIFSLIPTNTNISQGIINVSSSQVSSGRTVTDLISNNVNQPIDEVTTANSMQMLLFFGEVIWLMGIAILLSYSIFTAIKLYINLRNSTHVIDNIYEVNKIKTPFVFGIIRPRIYLPTKLSEREKEYIILHEQTHIKRYDHIVKPVYFLVTCVHWFNPFVWISFFLMGEDMELSCDESVIRQMGSNIKKEYSTSLLSLTASRRIIGGCPIAFGESNIKSRIKNVLRYKKPSAFVGIVATLVVFALIYGLLTSPKIKDISESINNNENIINTDVTNYDKISTYIQEESHNTFSPYYELLDFEISEYQEQTIGRKIEAIFFYKLIYKNYDKDPDTVGYIKKAKEQGNKNYQLLYDEYLQPKEMNFQLKVIINEDDSIALYSNSSPKGIKWEEVKMSDFIISR